MPHYQSVAMPDRRPKSFLHWLLFMHHENKTYIKMLLPEGRKSNTTMNWTEKQNDSDIPEMEELMFYTRWAKTIIGVRVGQTIKCGNQHIPLEDITHFALKPTPHDKSQD